MPAPRKRSRSFRKVFVRITTKTKTAYKKRKCKVPKCSSCGKAISGISKAFESQLRKMPKSKKKPSRPYANLCSSCMRKEIIKKSRE